MSTGKPISLTYIVGAKSDPGKRRKLNEDSILAISGRWETSQAPSGLFVVADGMGGYANGQDASSRAIQAIADFVLPKIARSHTFQSEEYLALLAEAMQCANKAVCQQNIDLHSKEGTDIDVSMLTTVTAVLVVGFTAYVAHVGNCRLYHYHKDERLRKITTDHTVVARLVEEGRLVPEDIYTHHARNQIYRALFNQSLVEIDTFTIPLQYGDTLLLCSRGLWNAVRDPGIEDILNLYTPDDPSTAADGLLQTALDSGGPNNISAIVVSVLRPEDPTQDSGLHILAIPDSLHIPQVNRRGQVFTLTKTFACRIRQLFKKRMDVS